MCARTNTDFAGNFLDQIRKRDDEYTNTRIILANNDSNDDDDGNDYMQACDRPSRCIIVYSIFVSINNIVS